MLSSTSAIALSILAHAWMVISMQPLPFLSHSPHKRTAPKAKSLPMALVQTLSHTRSMPPFDASSISALTKPPRPTHLHHISITASASPSKPPTSQPPSVSPPSPRPTTQVRNTRTSAPAPYAPAVPWPSCADKSITTPFACWVDGIATPCCGICIFKQTTHAPVCRKNVQPWHLLIFYRLTPSPLATISHSLPHHHMNYNDTHNITNTPTTQTLNITQKIPSLRSHPRFTPTNPTILGIWFHAARNLGQHCHHTMCERKMRRSVVQLRGRGNGTSKIHSTPTPNFL
jgi:hypothetical protein